MQRELSTFSLPAALKSKLESCGFLTTEDVNSFKPSELASSLSISLQEALDLQRYLKEQPSTRKSTAITTKQTAWDAMLAGESVRPIVTFSESLDGLLNGGVACGKLTEIAGAPGIGKTQLCIQLAVDVQIPGCFGGVDGEAVYIDTEGSFMVERVKNIASGAVNHCHFIAENSHDDDEFKSALAGFTVDSILSKIHYIRCHDHIELVATIHTLQSFIQCHPRVKLILIDSIAFPFRTHCDDYSTRSRLLNVISQILNIIAVTRRAAVVLTNQMTTKLQGEKSQLIPALGETWGHCCSIRLVLYWKNDVRRALLYKSSAKKEEEVSYQITMAGVRDV